MRCAMTGPGIGVVVIGRNEGERLRACLLSLQDVPTRVYVDSGSTDGSCALARSLGFDVVELAIPPGFTAARARNEGVDRLLARQPDLAFVQTVDGDCEVRTGWLDRARTDMAADPRRAVVFGRRRERRPEANAYHRVCDDEWDVPLGEVESCGGDALFRVSALRDVGGYNPALIAGEEPDLCLRLRQRGWRVWSNGAEMTLHDVAMDRFSQWWRRSQRAGFAFTELVRLHGRDANAHWRQLVCGALVWSAAMLAVAALLLLALLSRQPLAAVLAALGVALLAAQVVRLAWRQRTRMGGLGSGLQWAWLIMAGKLAQAQGYAQFRLQGLTRRRTAIIEYKGRPGLG